MDNKTLATELLKLATLLVEGKDTLPSARPTTRGLGPFVSPKTKEKTKGTLEKVRKQKRAKELEKSTVKYTKKYLGEMTNTLKSVVGDIHSLFADRPELAKLVWVALAATMRKGPGAIVKREVAPVDDWQIKPEQLAKGASVVADLQKLLEVIALNKTRTRGGKD